MKKSFFTFIALVGALASCFVSCSLDDGKTTETSSGYFTITGTSPNYKLIGDNGIVMYPTASSVNEMTSNKGFGAHRRAYFYVYYEPKNLTVANGVSTITDVELRSGSYLDEMTAITEQEAQKKGYTSADSIFSITSMDNSWLANGYFNTIFTADYSVVNQAGVLPSVHLSASTPSDNTLMLTMLYNRHTKKDAISNSGSFGISFDISKLDIPGNDTVTVTFQGEGIKTSSCKVPRKVFKYAQ